MTLSLAHYLTLGAILFALFVFLLLAGVPLDALAVVEDPLRSWDNDPEDSH